MTRTKTLAIGLLQGRLEPVLARRAGNRRPEGRPYFNDPYFSILGVNNGIRVY
jgi:hypothetical protein